MVELSDRERQALTLLSARAARSAVRFTSAVLASAAYRDLPQARRAKPDRGASRVAKGAIG
jgi:hypothetical protein